MQDSTKVSRLRLERLSRGLSIREVASYMNKAIPTIHQWEVGKAYPQIDDAIRLARFYGVRVEDLFEDIFLPNDTN